MPRRYRRFRRECQLEGRWYRWEGFVAADISPLETDAVLLAMFRAARGLLRDIRISRDIDQGSFAVLKTVHDLFRTQIVVDEATDFSPIQLACMAALADPVANSFFACGDFNQRITAWGTRSAQELKWVLPDVAVESINISYRHSQQLNDLAHRIALLSDPNAKKTQLPEDVLNDGVRPVLAKGLTGQPALAEWFAARIGEIEKVTGSMPSIAVLVNDEEEVIPLAEALDAALAGAASGPWPARAVNQSGRITMCGCSTSSTSRGLNSRRCSLSAWTQLAALLPDLFDKYPMSEQPAQRPSWA